MAEPESADALLAELEEAGSRLAPAEIEAFSIAARADLAEWRERAASDRHVGRDSVRIPERYGAHVESYIVFSAFVRVFVAPVAYAADIATIVRSATLQLRSVTYARWGEGDAVLGSINLDNAGRLIEDRQALESMAAELGQDVFGEVFSARDFWRVES